MTKFMLALMTLALLGTGVSFAADNPPAGGSTPAATDSAKKPAKKHVKKMKKAKKDAKDAAKPAEQPK